MEPTPHHSRGRTFEIISSNRPNTIRAGINDQVHDVGSNFLYILTILIYHELELTLVKGENVYRF